MRVFQVEGQWAMSHLRLSQRPQPQAERGQVRIKMAAAALNYRDLIVPTRGYGARMQELPLIMLSDGAGVVDQVGLGVTQFKEGDEVCPLLFQTWVSGPADAYKLSRGLGCETDGDSAHTQAGDNAGDIEVGDALEDDKHHNQPDQDASDNRNPA